MENSRALSSHINTYHQEVQLKSQSEICFGNRLDLTYKDKDYYLDQNKHLYNSRYSLESHLDSRSFHHITGMKSFEGYRILIFVLVGEIYTHPREDLHSTFILSPGTLIINGPLSSSGSSRALTSMSISLDIRVTANWVCFLIICPST